MKGTIDANILNAKEQILSNPKEMAEHTMIVDLMRNDLNIVAKETKVTNFRYIQKIKAGSKELLQVSSKIEAKLSNKWHEHLAIILDKLTPAGSISGTPKKKTLEIIDSVEPTKRGLYTGIFGIYDGRSLKSAVMIRAISKEHNNLFYYSGGGITLDSNPQLEYQELVDKIYLPF
jgi:para-aminobenzoate synthetase component 1